MKKIDFHCHTSPRLSADLPASDLSTITRLMAVNDIESTVLLATYFPQKGSGMSNYRLFHQIRDKPQFVMFGSLDFEHYFYQGYNELEELASMRALAGIKIYTGYQNIDLHGPKFHMVAKLAAAYTLPMLFHCGYSHGAQSSLGRVAYTMDTKASDLAFIPSKYGVRVIAAHMAKPHLLDTIETVRKTPLFYTDMSGLFLSSKERGDIPSAIEDVHRFVAECGVDTLLYGTDYPIQTHADTTYVLEQALQSFSSLEKRKIYYDNASALLSHVVTVQSGTQRNTSDSSRGPEK